MKKKSKKIAGLLGIFLGAFGVHNFYIGSYAKAVIQLLITVLSIGYFIFVSAIWGLIEGILILCGVIDINKKYRINNGTKEENEEFAENALRKFNKNQLDLYVKYVLDRTNLSEVEIKEIFLNNKGEPEETKTQQVKEDKKVPEVIETNNEQQSSENNELHNEQENNIKNDDTDKAKTTNSSNTFGGIITIVIILVIGIFIFRGCSNLFNTVSDSDGIKYARDYLGRIDYPDFHVDTSYSIGKIKSYNNSKIIESSEKNWYIFKVEFTFNPKLNNGSVDLTRERTASTYVVYNCKDKTYCCFSTPQEAKDAANKLN